MHRPATPEDVSMSRKLYIGGWFLLPFLWLVNFVYFRHMAKLDSTPPDMKTCGFFGLDFVWVGSFDRFLSAPATALPGGIVAGNVRFIGLPPPFAIISDCVLILLVFRLSTSRGWALVFLEQTCAGPWSDSWFSWLFGLPGLRCRFQRYRFLLVFGCFPPASFCFVSPPHRAPCRLVHTQVLLPPGFRMGTQPHVVQRG